MSTDTVLYGPNGEQATIPTVALEQAEAELLRKYKQFLAKYGLREALYCNACWSGDREDGCKAFVTGQQIGIQCRCKMRFYQGTTY